MLTYSGIEKKKFVAEAVKHYKMDAVEQGHYGKQNGHWRGCFIACSLRSYDIVNGNPLQEEYDNHADFEMRGIGPEWLGRLCEAIFEGLLPQESGKFFVDVLTAMPEGVDITPVKWRFLVFLLQENLDRVQSLDISDELKTRVVDAIRGVLTVVNNAIETGVWDKSAAAKAALARSAARSAAESAAWFAAGLAAWSAARSAAAAAESAAAAAESAAWSVAKSAESAAWSAAWFAARSAAWSAARSAAAAAESVTYQRYAKELIRLLKKA